MNTLATRQVRRATVDDLATLVHLRHAFRAEQHPVAEDEAAFTPRCAEWMRPRLVAESPWRAWVLEVDGAIVGTVWMQLVEKIPNPGHEGEVHAYVSSFYVKPNARGAGGGSMLLAAALDACRLWSVDSVFLWPTPLSRPLYERFGFGVREDILLNKLQ